MAGKRKVCLVRELLSVMNKREHTQSHSHCAVQVGSSQCSTALSWETSERQQRECWVTVTSQRGTKGGSR